MVSWLSYGLLPILLKSLQEPSTPNCVSQRHGERDGPLGCDVTEVGCGLIEGFQAFGIACSIPVMITVVCSWEINIIREEFNREVSQLREWKERATFWITGT